jgi:hypothetical protein
MYMVILLMEDGNVLDGKMKSLLDRCVRKLYAPIVASGYIKPSPLLGDLYCMLKDQDAPEAQELALRMEIYTAVLTICLRSLRTSIHRRISSTMTLQSLVKG